MKHHRLATEIKQSLTRVSIASVGFNIIANATVASAAELKQAPHFWYDSEDRDIPSAAQFNEPKVQMGQAAADHFRRSVTGGLAKAAFVLSSSLCLVIFVCSMALVSMGKKPGDSSLRASPASSAASQDSLEQLNADLRASLQTRGLTPETAQPNELNGKELKLIRAIEAKGGY